MKSIIFATLLLAVCVIYTGANPVLVACPAEVSEDCPFPQGPIPEYFAHPDDCSKFCECGVEGIAWEVQCGAPLLWNEKKDTCDWAENVDCGDRPQP